MTFNRYASYNFQGNTWNVLGINYNGRLMIGGDYTWEWQVPLSMVRSSPRDSYINFSPNVERSTQIYIKARASNGCGCSNWYGEWFNVLYNGDNGNGRPPIEYIN